MIIDSGVKKKLPLSSAVILAPHTDDGELGCGATIARMIREGVQVYYVAFSICEESVPAGYPRDILGREVQSATRKLGIKSENLMVYKYPVRHFNSHRQQILEDLVRLRKQLNPDWVFTPSSHDIHQDHKVINAESVRAFKNTASIFGYDLPWNQTISDSTALIMVTESDVQAKCEAFSCYKTQSFRPYDSALINSLAVVKGVQVESKLAEAFEVLRLLM